MSIMPKNSTDARIGLAAVPAGPDGAGGRISFSAGAEADLEWDNRKPIVTNFSSFALSYETISPV
jgi:hypothetical protein